MKICRHKEGSALTITIDGRLDTNSSPLLEEEISNLDGVDTLTLDFENVDYISSAGLRVLIIARKKMQQRGGMKLVNVCDAIRDILDVTGLIDFLTVE